MHHGQSGAGVMFHSSLAFVVIFGSKNRFITTLTTGLRAKPLASKVGSLIVVASIAKALSEPGGTRNLDKNMASVNLSEDLVLQILCRNSLAASKKLDFFHWCSLRPNYKHSVGTYSQMFHTICHCPQYHDEIFNLLTSLKRDGLVLDSTTFKLILDAFIRSGRFDSALEILDHVEKDLCMTISLNPDLYSSILIALVRKGQLGIALSIFLKLLENSSTNGNSGILDAVSCNELLVGLRKADMRDQFKQVFHKLREIGSFPLDRWGYNICIHAFGCWDDLATSLSLFKEMKDKSGSFSPDLCTYNSLIQVLCLVGKVNDALVVWEELKSSSGHEPDLFTYRILIQGCSKAYRIGDASKIFAEMQYRGFRPDTVVYNSLLDGLLKARKLVEACNLFEKMVDEDGVRASCWTYNILIDGLFRNGRAAAAYSLFLDLKKKSNNFVDGVTYSIVVLHLCREDQVEEALQLVEEMEARGFVVDLVTITSLLIALYRNGMWDSTERLMKYIRDGNFVSNVLKWKATMEASLKVPQSKKKDFAPMFPSRGNFTDILSLLSSADRQIDSSLAAGNVEPKVDDFDEWSSSPHMDLLANEVSPASLFSLSRGKRVEAKETDSFDIDMVNTYLSIFLSKGKLSLACKIFEIFTNMGIDPVSYTYNSIMSSFVKKGYFNEAWGVLQGMGEMLCPADIATYNVIIQCLGKMGRADLASAVLDKLMKQGGYLDIVMYNTLINALGKAGRIEEAIRLFHQMQTSGISPDVITYNTLIEVHSKAGRLKDAYKFLKMMLDAGCAPNNVTDTTLDFLEMEIEKLRYHKASMNRSADDCS
ncbi:pentatricopeptide repeat-containing protein At4g01570 [Coffea eugenioides]|uniref:pentatricopeptide repeat-containing protein At4g01570 n=1 Tax=Coffea eugenioides TaxID=49369 RepID=UPI000F610A3C|nr:pentatricopeptide repeat-containing protein At4g01570 [Coffea eugenioides]XP_027185210.1 pentatricopeptide repeat-containing protein At4g01570 [Coffea eugenioides]XP_027185211.1 pentatricopeptide repeat-containing protein At4g01570 [Coffea eugenioides]